MPGEKPHRGDPSAQLGRIVRLRRAGAGWTQADLGERMTEHGLSWRQSTVNRIETGLRPITWNEAVTLAALLDIDLSTAADTDEQKLRNETAALAREIDHDREQLAAKVARWHLMSRQLLDLDTTDEQAALIEQVTTKRTTTKRTRKTR
jgi:transcriptional regulator with XRE-family HTH domain